MATLEELEARVAALERNFDPTNYASAEDVRVMQRKVTEIESALLRLDPSKFASQEELAAVQRNMQALEDAVADLINVPQYKLPYSASELVEKLGKIE